MMDLQPALVHEDTPADLSAQEQHLESILEELKTNLKDRWWRLNNLYWIIDENS